MSNAMPFGKRSLAAVAAGALTAALVPFVATGTAQAAAVNGTVSPVRVQGATATTLTSVPTAQISWTTSGNIGTSDTAQVILNQAPTAAADLTFFASTDIGTNQISSGAVASGVGEINLSDSGA